MRLKGFVIGFVAIVLAIVIGFWVSAGFCKRSDVVLADYSVSEDGSTLVMRIGIMSSMGYARSMEARRTGDAVYCSFYQTFGGLNSGFGARNEFELEVGAGVDKIFFDRGRFEYYLVLRRDGDTWVRGPVK